MTPVSIDSVLELYSLFGNENYDEDVSQLAHALQCAALASRDGATEELIAAALLHDIGHLFEIQRNNGPDHQTDLRHEHAGAEFLRGLFPESVTTAIALHVEAKRYLAANEPAYFDALSLGSKRSLEVQGGPFTEQESSVFLAREGSSEAVALRRWDDHGKVIDLEVPEFVTWIPLLKRVAISE